MTRSKESAPMSEFKDLKPIERIDQVNDKIVIIPNPFLLSDISMLHKFLDLVVEDWQRAVAPFQEKIDDAKNQNQKRYQILQSYMKVKPVFLKCLFSYLFFFRSLDLAYEKAYCELEDLHLGFPFVLFGLKPKRTNYIQNIIKLRNIAITHLLSDREKNQANKLHAMNWDLNVIAIKEENSFQLIDITFQDFKSVITGPDGEKIESDLTGINGIPEMHQKCSDYLLKYNETCWNFLDGVRRNLPLKKTESEGCFFKQ